QEIEVVTYEKHSQESIIDFLRRTKLSPTKSYPKDTAILCYVAKNIIIPSWSELHNNLKDTHKENPVIILGQTNKDKEIYTICQIHPTIALITEFDLLKKSYNKKYLGVLRLQTGTGKKLNPLYLHKEKHYPFETLGVKSL
ncbi:hypothetical protein HY025_00005, partial [Candidatus Daviesbacteria bacterium]|nr:hypothetical protein [Candidatus Daviesbacteria bacterium]